MSPEPLTPEQRRANVEAVRDVQGRLINVRDKLAVVVAQAGPLFREVAELEEKLAAVLGGAAPEPAPEAPATPEVPAGPEDPEPAAAAELAEFAGAPE